MKLPLADSKARERFIYELDKNFCVSASAGAGKTTAIVKRIVTMAREDIKMMVQGKPLRLGKLVVVTYGVLAAEELRVRARQEIFEAMVSENIKPQQLLAEFNQAYFGTIHSFCLKLIHEEGRHAGLPGTVQLLDDEDERLWQRFIEIDLQLPKQVPESLIDVVLRHYSFDKLLDLAKDLGVAEASRLVKKLPEGKPPYLDFTSALNIESKRSKDLPKFQEELSSWYKQYISEESYLPIIEFTKGGEAFIQAVKDGFMPFVQWLNERACYLAAHLTLDYAAFRQAEGYLTYDDMIACARQLLESPEILERLRQRGYCVMLDEAQDTDSGMFDILTELTRPVKAAPFTWPLDPDAPGPLAGRFSFVGDDQQAIYGNRADLAHYYRYVEAYRKGVSGEALEFSVTMRCPIAVINQVNDIFLKLKQSLVEFRHLSPKPEACQGQVFWLKLEKEIEGNVDELFQAECQQVVAWLARQGRLGLGVQKWSEVAILCPRIDWLIIASKILKEHGIPSHLLSTKQRRKDFPAYSWPVALLHVLAHPTDRFELIGVLREVFCISDTVLLQVHLESDGLDLFTKISRSPDETESEKLNRSLLENALSVLGILAEELKIGQLTDSFSLAHFLTTMMGRLSLSERILAAQQDPEPLQNFYQAALLAEAEGISVNMWLGEQKKLLGKAPPRIEGNQDEVQLLTSLKSKGLEWPVVVALGLGRPIGVPPKGYPAVHRANGKVNVHFNNLTSDEVDKAKKRTASDEEYQRLFYVELTRAKKLLVLPASTHFYKIQKQSFGELCKLDPVGVSNADLKSSTESPSTLLPENDSWVDLTLEGKSQAYQNARQIPNRVLPHELAVKEDTRQDFMVTPLHGLGGVDYGTWWHAVMEHYPWSETKEEQDKLLSIGLDELRGVLELKQRAVTELELWQSSEARGQLLGWSKMFLTELPFAWPQSQSSWMEGIVDLVLIGKNGELAVLDWKTNRLFEQETLLEHDVRLLKIYGKQLQAYAEMLTQVSGRRVEHVWLYATMTGRLIEVK
jgi:ATP-dependent exoDNAse (exonuclease V) beta subunit